MSTAVAVGACATISRHRHNEPEGLPRCSAGAPCGWLRIVVDVRGNAWSPDAGDPAIPVWSAPRLRLPPTSGSRDAEGEASPVGAQRAAVETIDAEYVFTRAELQPVLHAIRASLGCGAVPLDSPHRLQDALTTLVRGLGGSGDIAVRRSPAALLTPEYWQVALAGVDSATHASLVKVFRMGRP